VKKWILLLKILFSFSLWRWFFRWLEYHYLFHAKAISKLRHCGKGTWIEPTVKFSYPENISIGNNCHINHLGCLQADAESIITIGNDLRMGPGTMIFASNHGVKRDMLIRKQPRIQKDIVIGNDVWLGSNVVITAGVTIGDGCVIGAGAVVTKNVPDYSIAVGIPAKVIKNRE